MPKVEPVTLLKNPNVKQAVAYFKEAVSARKAVILVGNCWVDYRGRQAQNWSLENA